MAPRTPSPGRTPVAVPTRAPASAARMFSGCSATAKPPIIPFRMSNGSIPDDRRQEGAGGKTHLQQVDEDEPEGGGQQNRCNERLADSASESQPHDEEENRGGADGADNTHH